MWSYVTGHFQTFLSNIELQPADHQDALGKAQRVGECLNRKYYQGGFIPENVVLVGSYGKKTAIRPTTDVDMLYFLPYEVFQRFNNYSVGGQSALLQEIKNSLMITFPTTEMRADGQVVQVKYGSYEFEVVPAFAWSDGIYICDTRNGGSWKKTDPYAEVAQIDRADEISRGSARPLIKYFKAWKRSKSVDIKSIAIEIAVCDFFFKYPNLDKYLNEIGRNTSAFWWHDWFVVDCFQHLLAHQQARIAGTGENIPIGGCWFSKAKTAHEIAKIASNHERNDLPIFAENQWRHVFGSRFPQTMPLSLLSSYGRGFATQTLLGGVTTQNG